MTEILDIKGKTLGCNTDQLDDRNCHVYLGERFVARNGNWAAIGKDRTHAVNGSRYRLSVVDFNLAIATDDRFIRVLTPA